MDEQHWKETTFLNEILAFKLDPLCPPIELLNNTIDIINIVKHSLISIADI